MLFSTKIKTIALAVLLFASIPQLRADTNPPESTEQQEAAQPLTPAIQVRNKANLS